MVGFATKVDKPRERTPYPKKTEWERNRPLPPVTAFYRLLPS